MPNAGFVAILRDGQTITPLEVDLRLASGDEIAAVGTEANLRLLETFSQGELR